MRIANVVGALCLTGLMGCASAPHDRPTPVRATPASVASLPLGERCALAKLLTERAADLVTVVQMSEGGVNVSAKLRDDEWLVKRDEGCAPEVSAGRRVAWGLHWPSRNIVLYKLDVAEWPAVDATATFLQAGRQGSARANVTRVRVRVERAPDGVWAAGAIVVTEGAALAGP